jgi:L(+)-tartrate dehydratase beta subunit
MINSDTILETARELNVKAAIEIPKDVAWKEELGLAQAMWVLEVKDFGPFMVESNVRGESLFENANKEINEKFLNLYEGLPDPVLKRMGEVTSPEEEVF